MELDRALIARRHLGERLPGTITGVQNFGLFVATLEPFLEGMIPVQSLPEDYYEPDEHGSMLIGTQTGHRFALGDPIEAEIVSVNLARRQVELRMVADYADRSEDPPTAAPPGPSQRLDPRKVAAKMGRAAPRRDRGRPRRPSGRKSARSRSRGSR